MSEQLQPMASKAMREKYWSEVDEPERVRRMRLEVKRLQSAAKDGGPQP